MTLYCFPFAGGNKYSFRIFEKNAPSNLNLKVIEYPGRGARVNEPLLSDIDSLVDDIFLHIEHLIKNSTQIAFYGHSMGGLVAYLVARKMLEKNYTLPQHLFVSGTSAPSSFSRQSNQTYRLERSLFIEEIRKLGGLPDEVICSNELFSMYEPILRADFQVVECYQYKNPEVKLCLPFTIITGTLEKFTGDDITRWKEETTADVRYMTLPGNHFFIYEQYVNIITTISNTLMSK